MYKILLLLFL